jgi:hypothetical protein
MSKLNEDDGMVDIEVELDNELYVFAEKRAAEENITIEEYLSKIVSEECIRVIEERQAYLEAGNPAS